MYNLLDSGLINECRVCFLILFLSINILSMGIENLTQQQVFATLKNARHYFVGTGYAFIC